MSDDRRLTIALDPASTQDLAAEDQARLALSRLGQVPIQRSTRSSSPGQTQRHRFVREGEVPTIYTSRLPERFQVSGGTAEQMVALQTELAQERLARSETEAALEQAKTTARSLQTRLGHMELQLHEACERADRAEQAVEVLRAETVVTPVRVVRESKPTARPTRRAEIEPKPVKWWVKK